MLLRWLFGLGLNHGDNNKPPSPSTPAPNPPAATITPSQIQTSAPTTADKTPPPPPEPTPPRQEYPPILSARSLRQLSLMLGGAGFLYWSVMISKRAALRHQLASRMRFFQGNQFMFRSDRELPRREPLVAAEALGLATLNTFAFAIMAAGGVSWAFDISSVEDLQRYAKRSVERSVEKATWGKVDDEAEMEVVEWFGRTFGVGGSLKGGKEGEGNGEKGGAGEGERKG